MKFCFYQIYIIKKYTFSTKKINAKKRSQRETVNVFRKSASQKLNLRHDFAKKNTLTVVLK